MFFLILGLLALGFVGFEFAYHFNHDFQIWVEEGWQNYLIHPLDPVVIVLILLALAALALLLLFVGGRND